MAVTASMSGLNCRKCSEYQKEERGCVKDSPIPGKWMIAEGETYTRCPLRLVTAESSEYLVAYGFFKMNMLPNGGSWLNETYKFLEAMQVIESHKQSEAHRAR